MISNQRNKRPVISFGLGKTEMTIPLGESVTVWQDEIYNDDFTLDYDGDRKESVYSFVIEPEEVGSFSIEAEVKFKGGRALKSNTIKLIVE